MTNLTAVLHRPRDIRIEDRPVPEPGPHEVLVAVSAVGVCGSDMHYYETGRIGDYVVQAPLVLGHEASGIVIGRGPQAQRHPLGQRVALEPGVPCGVCEQCRLGRYNLCPRMRFFATPPIDGAFAQYVTIQEDFAFALPDEISDAAGALLEPLSVAIWACQKADVDMTTSVLVTGAGPIGNLVAQVARAAGAPVVTVADINRERLARSAAVGATHTVDTSGETLADGGAGYDVLIECSGHEGVTTDAMMALRPAARAVLVGMSPHASASLPLAYLQPREISVVGTFRYANTYPTAISLVSSGRIALDSLVDATLPLQATDEGLRATRDNPALLKVIIEPGESHATSEVPTSVD